MTGRGEADSRGRNGAGVGGGGLALDDEGWLSKLGRCAEAVAVLGRELSGRDAAEPAWRDPGSATATLVQCGVVLAQMSRLSVELERDARFGGVRAELCHARSRLEVAVWAINSLRIVDELSSTLPRLESDRPTTWGGGAVAAFSRLQPHLLAALLPGRGVALRIDREGGAERVLAGVAGALVQVLMGIAEVVDGAECAIAGVCTPDELLRISVVVDAIAGAAATVRVLPGRELARADVAGGIAAPDVVASMRSILVGARRELKVRVAEVAIDSGSAVRTGTAEMARLLALALCALEAAVSELMRSRETARDAQRFECLEGVRRGLVAAGVVVTVSESTRTEGSSEGLAAGGLRAVGPSGVPGCDAVEELGMSLLNGSARAFGRSAGQLGRAELSDVLRELWLLLVAIGKTMKMLSRCGRDLAGARADAELAEAVEGEVSRAVGVLADLRDSLQADAKRRRWRSR